MVDIKIKRKTPEEKIIELEERIEKLEKVIFDSNEDLAKKFLDKLNKP